MFLREKTVIAMAKKICSDSDRVWNKDELADEITAQLMSQNRFLIGPFLDNLINPDVDYEFWVRNLVEIKLQKIKLRDHNFIRLRCGKKEISVV